MSSLVRLFASVVRTISKSVSHTWACHEHSRSSEFRKGHFRVRGLQLLYPRVTTVALLFINSTPSEVSAIPCALFGNPLRTLFLKNRDSFCYGEIFVPNTRGPLGCLLGFWPSGPKPCGGNWKREQEIEDGEPGTGNPERGTGYGEPGTESGELFVCKDKLERKIGNLRRKVDRSKGWCHAIVLYFMYNTTLWDE